MCPNLPRKNTQKHTHTKSTRSSLAASEDVLPRNAELKGGHPSREEKTTAGLDLVDALEEEEEGDGAAEKSRMVDT